MAVWGIDDRMPSSKASNHFLPLGNILYLHEIALILNKLLSISTRTIIIQYKTRYRRQ